MTTPARDWAAHAAPSLDDFEWLAQEAFDRLPEDIRGLCGDIVFSIENLAADQVLNSLGIEDPFELLGLYQGVSLDKRSLGDVGRQPDMVFLYRRAILDYWAEAGDETLADLVTHVLVHEIGHHFGLSDDDMERIESSVTTVT